MFVWKVDREGILHIDIALSVSLTAQLWQVTESETYRAILCLFK